MSDVSQARHEAWRRMLDFCVEHADVIRADSWDEGFIDDLSVRFSGKEIDLSFRQSSNLMRIYHALEDKVG
jgi:hypothetical protein